MMPKICKKNILLSAFGIHLGGGLVLLRSLLSAAESQLKQTLLDSRFEIFSEAEKKLNIIRVRKSFFSRIFAQTRLAFSADETDVFFSFNSLPPLIRSRAYVINYVHAPHFVGAHAGIKYSFITKMRILVERVWFNYGVYNCDEVWVQTESMYNALVKKYADLNIHIVPLVDELIMDAFKLDLHEPNITEARNFNFFYPADGVGHKNHSNLLKAWQILEKQGLKPNLILTLRTEELLRAYADAELIDGALGNILNLGRVSRLEVLNCMRESSALIFPSRAETFGIPMLEAKMLNIPILASERDYVRDVCAPVQTFDPESPCSIARAVCRFITGMAEPHLELFSPTQFVDLIGDRAKMQ